MMCLRVLVTGAFGSGKSVFVETISEVGIQYCNRKIVYNSSPIDFCFQFGRVSGTEEDDAFVLYFYTISGYRGAGFNYVEHIMPGLDGVVVLIDSCRVETFRQVRHIIDYCEENITVPYVIAATKQDLPDAWSAQDMQIALKLKEPVIPCCAHDVESVKQVILTLLERVLARIDEEEYEMKLIEKSNLPLIKTDTPTYLTRTEFVTSKAYRTLRTFPHYFETGKLTSVQQKYLSEIKLREREILIGVYENTLDLKEEAIAVTDWGIHVYQNNHWRFILYADIENVEFYLKGRKLTDWYEAMYKNLEMGIKPPEVPSHEVKELFLQLKSGGSITLSVKVSNNVGELSRFLTRVAQSIGKYK